MNMNDTQEPETRTKPSKEEILTFLKADLKAADSLRLDNQGKVDGWRAQYDGKPYGNEEKGKSSLVSRDIKRQDEWQHASVKDPFVSDADIITCTPVTAEDVTSAKQNALVLNYQFSRVFPRFRFMTNTVKLFYAEGTVVAKTSWVYEDREDKVTVPIVKPHPITGEPTVVGTEEVKKITVLDNRPYVELCRLEDIYLDPTAEGDIDRAQFMIHRYESDISSLRKAGKYKNLDKLLKSADEEGNFEQTDDTEFRFKDEARKKIIVYEYWGNFDMNGTGIAVPIVCTWVGDTILQLSSNPYPDKKMPFVLVANNPIPFQLYGEAYAELIGDNQKISTAVKRGILDNMSNSNNAQKGIRKGSLNTLNMKRFLNNKNFEFAGDSSAFYDGSYNPIPPSVFDVLGMVNNETESMVGVKSFSGGINGSSLGGTATAASGALDAVSVRRLDIVRNIAENFVKPIMRKWAAYNAEFLEEEEVIRITAEDFVQVRRDDLLGKIDISIEVSTAEDNAAKAQDLSFMLQTGQQTMDPGVLKLMQAEIFRLKKMPDLAKKIAEYQPEPDPFAERRKDLELRKLEVEIMERESRANENVVDMRAKNAKANLDEAKLRKLNSESDLSDLEFVRKAEGADAQDKMAVEASKQEGQPKAYIS
jgi:hypothetical protein